MRSTFFTAEIPLESRFGYWHDVVCKRFVDAESITASRENFDAALVSQSVGRIDVSRMVAPAHSWSRSMKHVRGDGQEHYLLSIVTSGTGVLEQCGRAANQQIGDIMLYDTSRPFNYALAANVLLVKIPRPFLDTRAPFARQLVATNLSTSPHLSTLLTNHVHACLDMELSEEAQLLVGDRLSGSFTDLLLAILDLRHEEQTGYGGGYDRLDKVKAFALANLGNSELTPQDLADAGRISIRTLNRVFGKLQTTPMRWVQHERLQLSDKFLRDGSVKSVTEAAFCVGFNDLAHFSRSFKQKFGYTPEQVRVRR